MSAIENIVNYSQLLRRGIGPSMGGGEMGGRLSRRHRGESLGRGREENCAQAPLLWIPQKGGGRQGKRHGRGLATFNNNIGGLWEEPLADACNQIVQWAIIGRGV